MFLPGNPHALRTMRRTAGERNLLVFYPESRLDGMISREEILGKKTIELYANRRDRLIYRSVTYRTDAEEPTGETEQHQRPLEIRKLTEKFSRDDTLNCDADVAKRVFYLTENRIRLDFHFGEDRITRSSRVFHKEGHTQIIQVKRSLFTTSLGIQEMIQVDPTGPKLTPLFLQEEFHHLLITEKNALQVRPIWRLSVLQCVSSLCEIQREK